MPCRVAHVPAVKLAPASASTRSSTWPTLRRTSIFPLPAHRRSARAEIHARGAGAHTLSFPDDGLRVTLAPAPQGLKRRRHHPLGRSAKRQSVISQDTARTMMILLRTSHPLRTGAAGRAALITRGRQDRHHQRLYRRLVSWLFTFRHLRSVDRLRQPSIAGVKRKPAPKPAIAHLVTLCARPSPANPTNSSRR